MKIQKCFFCDKIIVPFKYVSMQEVTEFFKNCDMDFTLNHGRSRRNIGNKIVCLSCETEIREITISNQKNICEECKNKEKEFE